MDELGRSFSVDSLGDSTRSLLSPLYRSSPEPYLSEGPLDDSSDEEIKEKKGAQTTEALGDYKHEQSGQRTRSNHSVKTSSSRNLNSYSYDSSFASRDNGGSKSSIKRTRTANSTLSYSSRRSLSALDDCHSKNDRNNKRLSSWEEWLVRKTLQDREKSKLERSQKKQEKEELERKKKDQEDKAKKAAEKLAEWAEEKNRTEVEKRRKRKEELNFEKRKKEEQKQLTELKSRDNFTKWCQEKREKKLEVSRQDRENARVVKDKQIERKLKNEQAFDEWLQQIKARPKPVHGSFGYTSGKLTGFYEWGTYPTPSYINPVPWVPTKPHRNKDRMRQKGKQEMQPPSPPLLFKELEQRISQRKKGNSHGGAGRNGKI